MTVMQEHLVEDLSFGRLYGFGAVVMHGCLISVALGMGMSVNEFGRLVASTEFVCSLALAVFACTLAAKTLSGHGSVLTPPKYVDPVRGDASRGPMLRRTVLRFKRLLSSLRPLRTLMESATTLSLFLALVAYLSICFGAPAFSSHGETLVFSALVTVLVMLPVLLFYGPDREAMHRIFLVSGLGEADPLARMLFHNAAGTVVGAWVGAFPIPLDWDRPWQAWPITCCLGALAGHGVASLWSLLVITSQMNWYGTALLFNKHWPSKKCTIFFTLQVTNFTPAKEAALIVIL